MDRNGQMHPIRTRPYAGRIRIILLHEMEGSGVYFALMGLGKAFSHTMNSVVIEFRGIPGESWFSLIGWHRITHHSPLPYSKQGASQNDSRAL
jgi:hypothetical protein